MNGFIRVLSYYKSRDQTSNQNLYSLYEGQILNAEPNGFGRIIGELPRLAYTYVGYMKPDRFAYHEFFSTTA